MARKSPHKDFATTSFSKDRKSLEVSCLKLPVTVDIDSSSEIGIIFRGIGPPKLHQCKGKTTRSSESKSQSSQTTRRGKALKEQVPQNPSFLKKKPGDLFEFLSFEEPFRRNCNFTTKTSGPNDCLRSQFHTTSTLDQRERKPNIEEVLRCKSVEAVHRKPLKQAKRTDDLCKKCRKGKPCKKCPLDVPKGFVPRESSFGKSPYQKTKLALQIDLDKFFKGDLSRDDKKNKTYTTYPTALPKKQRILSYPVQPLDDSVTRRNENTGCRSSFPTTSTLKSHKFSSRSSQTFQSSKSKKKGKGVTPISTACKSCSVEACYQSTSTLDNQKRRNIKSKNKLRSPFKSAPLLDRSSMTQKEYINMLSTPTKRHLARPEPIKRESRSCRSRSSCKESCPIRIAKMALPTKRQVYATWQAHQDVLPVDTLHRFNQILKNDGRELDLTQATQYFEQLRKKQKRLKRKFAKSKSEDRRCPYSKWLKNEIDETVEGLVYYFQNEPLSTLSFIETVMSTQIINWLKERHVVKSNFMSIKNPYTGTIVDICDKVVRWINKLNSIVNLFPINSQELITIVEESSVESLLMLEQFEDEESEEEGTEEEESEDEFYETFVHNFVKREQSSEEELQDFDEWFNENMKEFDNEPLKVSEEKIDEFLEGQQWNVEDESETDYAEAVETL